MYECITIVFNKFFKGKGSTEEEAIDNLKKEVVDYMVRNGIGGRYEVEVLCADP